MGAIQGLGLFIDSPETFASTSLYREGHLGLVHNPPGSNSLYQFVQLASTSDAAAVAKNLAYWSNPAKYAITMTIAESESTTGNSAAGITTVAVPQSSFCLLKLRGKHNVMVNAATAGVLAIPHSGSNQLTDNLETSLIKICGVFLTNASSNLADCRLQFDPV